MKIIFLDIDGVLRPTNYYEGRDKYGNKFKNQCVKNLYGQIEN